MRGLKQGSNATRIELGTSRTEGRAHPYSSPLGCWHRPPKLTLRECYVNWLSHKRMVLRCKQPLRNKILRSANAKYHYSYLFFYKINKGDLPLMFSCVKQRRFWETHVNRKWAFFSFSKPLRYRICIAKCLNSYRDDLLKDLFKITTQVCKKSISGSRALLKNVAA